MVLRRSKPVVPFSFNCLRETSVPHHVLQSWGKGTDGKTDVVSFYGN